MRAVRESSDLLMWLRMIAGLMLGIFILAAALEHGLVSRLSPETHQLSEYANDRGAGWVMTAGFFAWAVSLLATSAATAIMRGNGPRTIQSRLIAGLLWLAAVGMLITACFHTQTVAGVLPPGVELKTSGRLHDLGSGLATLAVLAAALLSVRSMPTPSWFGRVTACLVVFAVACDVALLFVGSSVGGLRQRTLVSVGCVWQALLLATLVAPRDRGPIRRRRPERFG